MNQERFEKVASLYLRVSPLDPAERESFLEQHCEGDPELRREVQSLLENEEQRPEILRTGSMGIDASLPSGRIPERVGPYRLREQLGEGGMGIVFLAEQESPIRRLVAIKFVRTGLETHHVVARFEYERQVLAKLHHPNIAQVLDAGTTADERPYFAMEYVEGDPITRFCDRHELTVEERLDLFIHVCDGVQHAHRNAIIHRDIKPTNVLVCMDGGNPIPKIIDFGIAKALDQPLGQRRLPTLAGQLIGTPDYMSPEQATGTGQEVDTRTDVYSLGVLLYEMITGTRPFDFDAEDVSYEEIRRRIREEEPVRPSERIARLDTGPAVAAARRTDLAGLSRRLRGDLDWIVMKALEKTPARRYASPSDLAADIGRHLRHEPVVARSPSVTYRLGRFTKRHRAAVGLAALLGATLVGFTVTGTIQAARISLEAGRAKAAALQATREADAAATLSGFLLDLFDNSAAIRPRGRPVDFVDQAVGKARRELADRPILQARLLQRVGGSYHRLRLFEASQSLFQESAETFARLLGAEDPETISAFEILATSYIDCGRLADAEPILIDLLEARRRALGSDHLDTYRTMSNLANLYKRSGESDKAAQLFEESVAGLERFQGIDNRDTLISKGWLMGVYLDLGRYETAAMLLPDLAERMERVLGRGPETAIAHYNLGCAYANLGDTKRALRHLRESIDRGFAYPGSVLSDAHLRPLSGTAELDLLDRMSRLNSRSDWNRLMTEAEVRARLGDFEAAETLLLEIIEATGRAYGSRNTASAFGPMRQLADLYLRQGRFGDAERVALEMLDVGGSHPLVPLKADAESLWLLAQCHIGRGNHEEARQLIEESLASGPVAACELPYVEAMQLALTGQTQEALVRLSRAADLGYSDAQWLARDLAFETLRGNAEFEAISARIAKRAL